MARTFINTLLSDLKRSIISRMFVIAIIITIIAMWVGCVNDVIKAYNDNTRYTNENGETLQMFSSLETFDEALSSEALLLFMPIIAAIPFTTALLDDIKSGFIKHYLSRSRYLPYTISKTIASALSSGLALALGVLIGYFTIVLIVSPIEINPVLATRSYLMDRIIPYAFSGMLWSLVGMLMSIVTMNKYMAYASPFILYYVLVIMAERYFRNVYVLNPQNYVTLVGDWDLGAKSAYITLGLLIIGVAIILNIVAQRRIRT